MSTALYMNREALEAGLETIRQSPKDSGVLRLIVRRPQVNARELLQEAQLDPDEGLVGDTWKMRGSSKMDKRVPHPDMQLTLINSRLIALLAQQEERWALAGDQLYVDFDLSVTSLPPWTTLAIGSAVIQVTDQPHTGCVKFSARFGPDALKFVNSSVGRELRLRGMNTKVIKAGTIRLGDAITKTKMVLQ
ncbi:MAG: MOSC domain-containing protein [Chloroflexi bacterium]|nr:MOSC domain-containing protein [Chloroflexota bacterium]